MVRLVSHRTTICAGLAKATGVSWAFADRLPLCTLPFSGFFGREATGLIVVVCGDWSWHLSVIADASAIAKSRIEF